MMIVNNDLNQYKTAQTLMVDEYLTLLEHKVKEMKNKQNGGRHSN
jgi:hypothetical protein